MSKTLRDACSEVFFGAVQALRGKDPGKVDATELSRMFNELWARDRQRLCDLASRCVDCLRFHDDAQTCEQYRKSADAREVEHAASFRESMRWFPSFPLRGYNVAPEPAKPAPEPEEAPKHWYKCTNRSSACAGREQLAETEPSCYICGSKMARSR